MLTHHLQDPNCNISEYLKHAGGESINKLVGRMSQIAAQRNGMLIDPNDASFSSEKFKHAKMDSIEKEISRLIVKNGG